MKVKFQYSIFIGLIVATQTIHGSAAAVSIKEKPKITKKSNPLAVARWKSAIYQVLSKKTAQFHLASQYRMLAATRQQKLVLALAEAPTDSDLKKLQKRNGELAITAQQAKVKEELLQHQYAHNKELRAKLSTAEHTNRLLTDLNRKLSAENKLRRELEQEKKKLEEQLKQLSVTNADLVSKAALSESTAAADLP